MTEEDAIKLSVVLRQNIMNVFREFYNVNKLNIEQSFKINSVVLSSVVAQISFDMFKKDIGTDHPSEYIDSICDMSKMQLKSASMVLEEISRNLNEHDVSH